MKDLSFRILLISICAFAFSLSAFSQDFKLRYKDARDLYAKGEYTKAMSEFNSLIVYDTENPYSEYASYYYGLSAYKLGFATVSKDIFLKTVKLYPKWDHLDEVNYMLAKIYFDQREYFRALTLLKSIKSQAVLKDVDSMKRFYLSQINDAETLKMVLEEFPQEKEAARPLVQILGSNPVLQREDKLFDSLIRKFHFNKDEFVTAAPLTSIHKKRYSISLMLPFLASTLDPSAGVKRNQYVLDLYEGMKQAADTLRNEGIFLDLLAYDTERNPEVLKKLLLAEELKSTDMIVGPLFAEESRLLLPYSEKNKINIINPVSNNSDYLGQNPFALLFEPSHETIGISAANIAKERAVNKKCIVYYGESPKDSVTAYNFIRKATELGLKVVIAEEIHKENSARILTTLATPTEYDDYKNPTQFTIRKDSLGCVFVATDDPLIFSKAINAVETRGDSVLVIGNETWIAPENNTVDFSIFERIGVILASPNFSSISNPHYIAFRKNYILRHGTIPSLYARTGYECILFLGRALNVHGVYFQSGLSQTGVLRGGVGEGFSYPGTRDNQVVPFVQFRNGQLVVINKK